MLFPQNISENLILVELFAWIFAPFPLSQVIGRLLDVVMFACYLSEVFNCLLKAIIFQRWCLLLLQVHQQSHQRTQGLYGNSGISNRSGRDDNWRQLSPITELLWWLNLLIIPEGKLKINKRHISLAGSKEQRKSQLGKGWLSINDRALKEES